MRKEYDFSKMKVKRRGPLPMLLAPHKVKVTILQDAQFIRALAQQVARNNERSIGRLG